MGLDFLKQGSSFATTVAVYFAKATKAKKAMVVKKASTFVKTTVDKTADKGKREDGEHGGGKL